MVGCERVHFEWLFYYNLVADSVGAIVAVLRKPWMDSRL